MQTTRKRYSAGFKAKVALECVFHVHLATDSMRIWPAIP